MSRKHIDIDAPTPASTFVRTVLTGTLDVPFGGAKPQVRLVQTSAGYEVVFEAHGETRGRWFEHLGQAEKYFERLTGRSSGFEYVTRRTIVRRAAGAALGVVAAALIGCMVSGSAFADCGGPSGDWMLLGVDVFAGVEVIRDTSKDFSCPNEVPAFSTKAECEAALRRVIGRYAGKSHAGGDYGFYQCSNLKGWKHNS